jgi:hypothetical protein
MSVRDDMTREQVIKAITSFRVRVDEIKKDCLKLIESEEFKAELMCNLSEIECSLSEMCDGGSALKFVHTQLGHLINRLEKFEYERDRVLKKLDGFIEMLQLKVNVEEKKLIQERGRARL